MTDWGSLVPRVSRLVCEDEVSGLAVNKRFIICQFWIQPEIAVFSRYNLEQVRLLEGHEYGGQCVSVLDNGIVFSASLDRTLRTWDSDRGVQIDIAEDHTDYIQSLCVENGWVATGGQGDKKIMVYRTNSGGKLTRKHTCCGHTGWVRKLAIMGETMVSGSLDMTLRVWDLVTGHQVRSLAVDSPIMSLHLPLNNLVIYGDKVGKVSFINLNTSVCTHLVPSLRLGMDKYRRSLKFHDGSVDALVFKPREKLLVTGSDDKFIKMWRIEQWEEDVRQCEVTEIDTIREHCDYINGIVIRHNFMYSSSGDINVIIHEFPNPNAPNEVEPPVRQKFEAIGPLPSNPSLPPSPKIQIKAVEKLKDQTPPPEIVPFILEPDSIEEIEADDEQVPEIDETEFPVDEETENTSSEASTETTSTSLARRRRWLIFKEEIELKEEIGKGRYGIVYRGIYKKKDVAVKISNKISKEDYASTEEGIIKEVGSFCRCKHPTLVRYYGLVANKEDFNFWLVTEFVTGHSLASLVHNPEVKSLYKIRRRERLHMSACLASAIDYIHKRGLINGDLTGLNVLVSKKGKSKEVKITDYGLLYYKEVVEDVNYTPDNKLMQNINCFVPPEVLVGHNQWSEKCDVWCLAALLLEFNLENYMWDNQTIEKSKSNYINKAGNKEPIRFGLKIRWSSFTFLWDALSYQIERRPGADKICECCEMLITQSCMGIREMELCDDMILWCSLQLPLLADWKNFARRLGVQSVIPIVRDVIESSEKVSVILESWKLKYGDEATVVRLVSGIQMMDLQEVVDEFYREFQIPRKVKAKKQKSE